MDIFIDQYRPNTFGGDPFAADVIFLMLGEGPTDGTQVNPTTGTLLVDEISTNLQGLGLAPTYLSGATVSASTSGMPFGNSWIRHPGGLTSNNFIGCVLPSQYHPRNDAMTWDGWFQLDSLADDVCLFGDDTAATGVPYNIYCVVGTTGTVRFVVRTGLTTSGTSTSVVTAGGVVTANTPFHVECWGDGAGNIGIAVNGVMVTGTCIASTTGTSSFVLGCQNRSFSGFERVITGYSKCFRITAAVRHTADFTPPASLDEYAL